MEFDPGHDVVLSIAGNAENPARRLPEQVIQQPMQFISYFLPKLPIKVFFNLKRRPHLLRSLHEAELNVEQLPLSVASH
jgi:hypothetical protein